ncbi:MAG: hypothetical protein RJA72_1016, partial [Pseudomonadota bacterium]
MLYRCFADCSHHSHDHGLFGASSFNMPELADPSSEILSTSDSPQKVRRNADRQRVIDIHCHYLNPEVARKTIKLKTAAHDPSIVYANDLTRQTNVKQMADRASKLSDIGERIREMDRMGVD